MTTQTQSVSRWARLRQTPAIRLVVELLLFVAALIVAQVFVSVLPNGQSLPMQFFALAIVLVLTLAAYAGIVRLMERRRVSEGELALPGAAQELAAGIAIGGLLFSAVIAILWVLGYYQVSGVNGWAAAVNELPGSISSGVVEELLFRGMLFRLTEDWLGAWPAILISSLLFGLMHLTSPNATLWAATAVAIEAGLLLAAAYLLTRRLWLAMGIHFAWDFVQSGIFGGTASGNPANSLLNATFHGPEWLSGGSFGAEASVFAVAACVLVSLLMLRLAIQRGHLLPRRKS